MNYVGAVGAIIGSSAFWRYTTMAKNWGALENRLNTLEKEMESKPSEDTIRLVVYESVVQALDRGSYVTQKVCDEKCKHGDDHHHK